MVNRLLSKFFNRSLNDPRTSFADPANWLWTALGARTATTGVPITPQSALEVSAVWAAVRRISSTIATLPLPVYKQTSAGKERAPEHPAYRLLHDRPNPEQSSFVFREMMLAHLLLFGNFFAEIERNGRGDPIALWPLNPADVTIRRIGERLEQKVYLVRVAGQEVPLSPDDMLHVPGFGYDGQLGLIPTLFARNAIGLAKATETFGAAFFANGAAPSGVLSHPGTLGRDGVENLRASWNAAQSGLTNAQRVAILEEGMTWTPLGVPPEASQFIETRKFTVAEIARVFLIPPHMLGDLERATFSNVEQQSLEYVVHCIEPWTRRIEQELNYKLFGDSGYCTEFVLEGLLRGDSTARSAYYTSMANLGVLSINEIRERENLPRIPEGDVRFTPLNMTPLGQAPATDTTPAPESTND